MGPFHLIRSLVIVLVLSLPGLPLVSTSRTASCLNSSVYVLVIRHLPDLV
jgi:ABC-type arginine transport system permease subunit